VIGVIKKGCAKRWLMMVLVARVMALRTLGEVVVGSDRNDCACGGGGCGGGW
jgi:hypothetical protein